MDDKDREICELKEKLVMQDKGHAGMLGTIREMRKTLVDIMIHGDDPDSAKWARRCLQQIEIAPQ